MKCMRLMMVLTVSLLLLCAPVQADFYVIPVPAGIGTRIDSLPCTISQPGLYYLTKDLTSTGHGIIVDADNVTIDLMGFSLIGPGTAEIPISGVYMNGRSNVEVRNGTIRNFFAGVHESSYNGKNHRIHHIRALGNQWGLCLHGGGHAVENCTASNNTSVGIYAFFSIIQDCITRSNSVYGIYTYYCLVTSNVAVSNGTTNIEASSCTLVGNHAQ